MKKNRIFSRVLSGVLAGALALSLSACGSSSTASSDASADGASDSGTTHLRLIYSPSLCAAPMASETCAASTVTCSISRFSSSK